MSRRDAQQPHARPRARGAAPTAPSPIGTHLPTAPFFSGTHCACFTGTHQQGPPQDGGRLHAQAGQDRELRLQLGLDVGAQHLGVSGGRGGALEFRGGRGGGGGQQPACGCARSWWLGLT